MEAPGIDYRVMSIYIRSRIVRYDYFESAFCMVLPNMS
jgi:hypothetical protein